MARFVFMTSSNSELYAQLKKPLEEAGIQCSWCGNLIDGLELLIGKLLLDHSYVALISESVVNGIHIAEALKIMDYLEVELPVIILLDRASEANAVFVSRRSACLSIVKEDTGSCAQAIIAAVNRISVLKSF